MSAPVVNGYGAWVGWVEAFRHGENPPVDGLAPMDGRMGSYVEARLEDRIAVAFGERVRQWQGALGDRIVARPPNGPTDAAVLLRESVERLEPLTRLAASPLLPRSLGSSMHHALSEVRDGARSALDDAWRRRREEIDDAVVRVPAPRGLTAGIPGARTPAGPAAPTAAAGPVAPGGRSR